jgi:UDP-glucose/GDP-mannose dehydrogenase family, central domain
VFLLDVRQVAEMVKLLENTFRMINIGLVNELAVICDRMGIDVWEVIDAAATKPFASCPSIQDPDSAATAFPSIPSISPGRPARQASKHVSSSWLDTSTAKCPTSSSKSADRAEPGG